MCFVPLQSFASGWQKQYHPGLDSDFNMKKWSYKLFTDANTTQIRFTQYKPPENQEIVGTLTWNVKPNSSVWVDQYCSGLIYIEFLDKSGSVVNAADSFTWGDTGGQYISTDLQKCTASSFVKPSTYDETKNQYSDDTFGGTKPKEDPIIDNGSGGNADSGIDDGSSSGGEDPGTGGDSSGGTAPGTGGACGDSCSVFNCPGWSDYMGKLTDIKNAIPPAPDWNKVADIFKNTIAPQIKSDLADVIGSAPSEPQAPSQPNVSLPDEPPEPAGVDDHGFKNSAPTGQEDPDLGKSSFTEDDIKSQAPVIKENKDPTGGFKIDNPMDSLPSLPTDNFPIPGQTDAGDWGKNKPSEQDTSFPKPPTDSGDYSAPKNPKDDGGDFSQPTNPKDDGTGPTSPTNPSDNTDQPPIPSGDGGDIGGKEYYKDHPDP